MNKPTTQYYRLMPECVVQKLGQLHQDAHRGEDISREELVARTQELLEGLDPYARVVK